MSTILLCPDYATGLVNLVGSMKPFIVGSTEEVSFTLQFGGETILDEVYMPTLAELTTEDLYGGPGGGNGSLVSYVRIAVNEIIDRLLDIVIPANGVAVTQQPTGVGDFTATIDGGTPIVFRVIKGGIAELNLMTANPWLDLHWLTWQPQIKEVLQMAPEWLGIYPITGGNVQATAYFTDGTSHSGVLATLTAGLLYTIDTSWPAMASWSGGEPAAWDVWYDGGSGLPVQRYLLRYPTDEEHLFVWVNTLGGVDSMSFTGYCEEDEKLEHKNLIYNDEVIAEYDLDKPREYRQATGFLDEDERLWIKDFFYSRKKFRVRPDGSFGGVFTVKSIAVVSSKVISNSADDEFNFEFTYRLGVDEQRINLDRTTGALPPPEGLSAFFLTDLLSSLPEASYAENLLMAVQSPYAIGWQKLTLEQLWGGGLPMHIDGTTIRIINGRLTAFASGGNIDDTFIINLIKSYLDSLNISYNDSQTILLYGAMLWQSGLTYTSTDTVAYKILGVRYTAVRQTLTLDAADPNLSRIDVFYADNTQNIKIMKGISAQYPIKPAIAEAIGVEICSVFLEPGALTPGNALVEKVYDEHTVTEWTTSEVHDPDVLIDFDNLIEPLAGIKRIKIETEALIGTDKHYVGESYHGGIIFKLFTETTGLIAAVQDTAFDVFYESLAGGGTTGATGIAIGTGQANTELLLANSYAQGQAVKYCDDLIVGAWDDWYFPSEDELYEMYINRFLIGGFATKTYWSSTEANYDQARCISFANGTTYGRLKNNRYAVRAIRTFNDVTDPVDPMADSYVTLENTIISFVAEEQQPTREGILSFNIKSSLAWRENSILRIEAFLENKRVGVVTMSRGTNMFSYRPGDNIWRRLAVQMYQMAPNDNFIDCFRFTFLGSWPNHLDLGFDDIRYQHGKPGTQSLQQARRQTDYAFRELPDGTRMVFTTLYPYIKKSTEISQNGVRQIKGDYQHFMEWNDQIYFFYPPELTGAFVIDYLTLVPAEDEDKGSGDADFSGSYNGSFSSNLNESN